MNRIKSNYFVKVSNIYNHLKMFLLFTICHINSAIMLSFSNASGFKNLHKVKSELKDKCLDFLD